MFVCGRRRLWAKKPPVRCSHCPGEAVQRNAWRFGAHGGCIFNEPTPWTWTLAKATPLKALGFTCAVGCKVFMPHGHCFMGFSMVEPKLAFSNPPGPLLLDSKARWAPCVTLLESGRCCLNACKVRIFVYVCLCFFRVLILRLLSQTPLAGIFLKGPHMAMDQIPYPQ